jgi:hypothetical protein
MVSQDSVALKRAAAMPRSGQYTRPLAIVTTLFFMCR